MPAGYSVTLPEISRLTTSAAALPVFKENISADFRIPSFFKDILLFILLNRYEKELNDLYRYF
jgi:hypothetical protein